MTCAADVASVQAPLPSWLRESGATERTLPGDAALVVRMALVVWPRAALSRDSSADLGRGMGLRMRDDRRLDSTSKARCPSGGRSRFCTCQPLAPRRLRRDSSESPPNRKIPVDAEDFPGTRCAMLDLKQRPPPCHGSRPYRQDLHEPESCRSGRSSWVPFEPVRHRSAHLLPPNSPHIPAPSRPRLFPFGARDRRATLQRLSTSAPLLARDR